MCPAFWYVQVELTVGQDGFRDESSNQGDDLAAGQRRATGLPGMSLVSDRLIPPSALFLASLENSFSRRWAREADGVRTRWQAMAPRIG
jgi:hypothetical protein